MNENLRGSTKSKSFAYLYARQYHLIVVHSNRGGTCQMLTTIKREGPHTASYVTILSSKTTWTQNFNTQLEWLKL